MIKFIRFSGFAFLLLLATNVSAFTTATFFPLDTVQTISPGTTSYNYTVTHSQDVSGTATSEAYRVIVGFTSPEQILAGTPFTYPAPLNSLCTSTTAFCSFSLANVATTTPINISSTFGSASTSPIGSRLYIYWCDSNGSTGGGSCANLSNLQTAPDILYTSFLIDVNGNAQPDLAPAVTQTGTRFISYVPTLGTTTPVATSTAFQFQASYYVDPTDFSAGDTQLYMRYRQMTGMGKRDNPVTGASGEYTWQVPTSGYSTSTITFDVQNTGVYDVYWQLKNDNILFDDTLTDTLGNFVVASTTDEEVALVFNTNNTTAPTVNTKITAEPDCTTCSIWDFVNIPNLLKTKSPFGYVFKMYSIVTSAGSSASTTAVSGKVFAGLASTSPYYSQLGSVDFLNQNTIKSFMPNGTMDALRSLITVFLYVGTAFSLFFIGGDIFRKQ